MRDLRDEPFLARDHDATTRLLAVALFGVGGGLGVLSLLLAGTAPGFAGPGWVTSAVSLAAAAAIRVAGARLPPWWIHGAAVLATLSIVTNIAFDAYARSALEAGALLLFVWLALVIGYAIDSARAFAAHLALIVTAIGAVMVESPPPAGPAGNWVRVAGSCIVTACAVRALRRRLEAALAQEAISARTDALTGLANRRLLAERFVLEQARARRTGEPLALVLGDLDRFKALNDRHGHEAGDHALRRVGEVVLAGSRAVDLAARAGGEEFVVLLPGTTIAGAADAAERLRAAVAAAFADTEHALTITCGVAAVAPDAVDLADALRPADAALYTAKDAGRDRVAVAASPV